MNYNSIAAKILELEAADLALREKLIRAQRLGEGYNEEMKALHDQHAELLDHIIDKIGYPTNEKVGEAASSAAWLIIQHAIGKPEFVRKCRRLLANAVNDKRANPQQLAYLDDRIAVNEGRLQLYGTQFGWDENGELSPNPYDNLAKVNARRQALSLNSLAEQTEIIRRRAEQEHQTPPDNPEKRKREIEHWRRQTGWII